MKLKFSYNLIFSDRIQIYEKWKVTDTKKAPDFSEAFERKTRLEPAADAAASPRFFYTTPTLLKEGARGRSSEPLYKKRVPEIPEPF